jgi:hypothetical protein
MVENDSFQEQSLYFVDASFYASVVTWLRRRDLGSRQHPLPPSVENALLERIPSRETRRDYVRDLKQLSVRHVPGAASVLVRGSKVVALRADWHRIVSDAIMRVTQACSVDECKLLVQRFVSTDLLNDSRLVYTVPCVPLWLFIGVL